MKPFHEPTIPLMALPNLEAATRHRRKKGVKGGLVSDRLTADLLWFREQLHHPLRRRRWRDSTVREDSITLTT